MNKKYLLAILEKYYLNGLIEKSRISIKDKNLEIKFVSVNKDLVGIIQAPNFELIDSNLAVNDTTRLLKLIGITDETLELSLTTNGVRAGELLITDGAYNLEFRLADIELVKASPEIEEPHYDISFDITVDFIDKFNKAKKALDTEIVTIETVYEKDIPSIKFNLGGKKGHTNKINFSIPATLEIPGTSLTFKIDEIKEILDANKDLKQGTGYINDGGLFKFQFTSEQDIQSTYLLVARED